MNANEIVFRIIAAVVAGWLYALLLYGGISRRYGRPATLSYAWVVATATAWAGFLFFLGQTIAAALAGVYIWPDNFVRFLFWGGPFCVAMGITVGLLMRVKKK